MKQQAIQLTLFGEVYKTFGANGELIVKVRDEALEVLQKKEPIFISIDGLSVPFYFKSLDTKGTTKLLVVFENMETEALAKELLGKQLFFVPKRKPKKQEDETDTLLGFTVIDKQLGELGTVKELMEIPGNPCLVVDYKGREVIVPLNEQLIERVDAAENRIYFDLPEGLLDL